MHLVSARPSLREIPSSIVTSNPSFDFFPFRIALSNFSIDDGNGMENVSFKMNSRFFNLCRVYSSLLKMASVGEFPWS